MNYTHQTALLSIFSVFRGMLFLITNYLLGASSSKQRKFEIHNPLFTGTVCTIKEEKKFILKKRKAKPLSKNDVIPRKKNQLQLLFYKANPGRRMIQIYCTDGPGGGS